MTQVVKKSWNLDRMVFSTADGKLTIKGKNRGKIIEIEIPDAGISDKLGEPSQVYSEGRL